MKQLRKSQPTSVCIVVENLPVPIDRRVWCEAQALRDAGYIVSVICPMGKLRFTEPYELLDGVHIYRHRAWEAKSLLGYLLEYTFALTAELYLTLKVFATHRFTVLHACNPPDTIFLIGLLLRPLGVRFIFDHHDLAPELFEAKFGDKGRLLCALTRLAEKCSFRLADASIATNDSFKEIATTRGGKRPDRVFVVRNCPDLKTLTPGPSRPELKGGRSFLVVYVGFMGKQDGLDLLIDSIEDIVKRQNRHDTHFAIVGGGTILPELREMVSSKGLDSFVDFTGQIAHEEVVTYLSNADIGVAPDPKTVMNDNSTMIKLFEYMAFGLPAVLFDLKEGRRVAGPAALYATPNDPVDFARHIGSLLDNADLRQRLGAYGRAQIHERLNWDNEKLLLLRAYNTVLGINRPAQNARHTLA